MRIEQKVAVLALFAVLLTSCGSAPKVENKPIQASCDFLPQKPEPAWVFGDSQIEGFYTGVGDSDASKQTDDATQSARTRALANLSSNIKTNVSQQLNIQISESGSNNDNSKLASTDIESQTQSITNSLLENSIRDGLWYDRKGCRVFVRMKVAKKGVEDIKEKKINKQRLAKANMHFQKSLDRKKIHARRMESIEAALKLVEKIDFSMLPLEDRDHYIKKFRKQQVQLSQQMKSQEVVVITMAKQELPDSVHKELAFRMTKGIAKSQHFYPAPCENRKSCLEFALDVHAKQLIIVSARTRTSSGAMGSRVGDLTIDAALYDVASQRQLHQFQNQTGQVLTFDANNMHWEQAVNRLFKDNAPIKQLQTIARDCGVQNC